MSFCCEITHHPKHTSIPLNRFCIMYVHILHQSLDSSGFLSDCKGLVSTRRHTAASGNHSLGLMIQHTAHTVAVGALALSSFGSVHRDGHTLGVLNIRTTRVLRMVLGWRRGVGRVWNRILLAKDNVVNCSHWSGGSSAFVSDSWGFLVRASISQRQGSFTSRGNAMRFSWFVCR